MMETVYKVVRSVPTVGYLSCCLNESFPKEYQVRYEFDVVAKPALEGSKLFVFTHLPGALDFVAQQFIGGGRRAMRILRCETPSITEFVCGRLCLTGSRNIKEYWAQALWSVVDNCYIVNDRRLDKGMLARYARWPEGTVLCDELTPRELVWCGKENS